jgi:hypothetical protein
MNLLKTILFCIGCSAANVAGAGTSVGIGVDPVGTEFIVKSWTYKDRDGEHLLKLYKRPAYSSSDNLLTGYSLYAVDYLVALGVQSENWRLVDGVSCAGLDFEADYFFDHISIVDLNRDGRKEVVVPYRLFCGGGVDPKTIKVIMKGRGLKFAIRGESKLVFSNGEHIGGEMSLDKPLDLPENSAFKTHLLNIWKAVYIEKQ